MRISDWSSDVCSSDLGIGAQMLLAPRRLDLFAERPCAELHLGRRAATGAAPSVLALDTPPCTNTYCASILTRPSSVYRADRTSVVAGQSVPVRVDLRGRRTIKNNKISI